MEDSAEIVFRLGSSVQLQNLDVDVVSTSCFVPILCLKNDNLANALPA